MILDEIYEAIRKFRNTGYVCPFDSRVRDSPRCDWCLLLFPEIKEKRDASDNWNWCPCDSLNYVKSEMWRLFP